MGELEKGMFEPQISIKENSLLNMGLVWLK